jgi:hypothetical protein
LSFTGLKIGQKAEGRKGIKDKEAEEAKEHGARSMEQGAKSKWEMGECNKGQMGRRLSDRVFTANHGKPEALKGRLCSKGV